MKSSEESPAKQSLKIEKLLGDTHEEKTNIASQHKMLNHIGSSIDDVHMDQASFFKIFHSLRNEEQMFLGRYITLGPDQNSFSEPLGESNSTLGNLSAIGTYTQQRAGTSKLSLQGVSLANELKDQLSLLCDMVIT
jgi:hypothetical protein